MIDYEYIKRSVTMREVAERYGFAADRTGCIPCPFHNEKTPSCRLYEHSFFCFGCDAGGDVINFVARVERITNSEAAAKLSGEHLIVADPPAVARRRREREKVEKFKRWEHDAFNALLTYYRRLCEYQKEYKYPHRLYIQSLTESERIKHLLDVFTTGSGEEKLYYYTDTGWRRVINGCITDTGRHT